MTDTTSYDNISIVVRQTNHNNGKCASGSAVEHLLAKEGVAGSIPVSRLKKNDTKSVSFFQTVDKAPSCEGALSTVCLFIVIFTVIFSFPNHASYFL